jgi:uncharacterized C2H2 Zn-finger protein
MTRTIGPGSTPGSRATGEAGLKCLFCGLVVASPAELERHVVAAHAGRPFPPRCEICGAVFESPADLQVHHRVFHRSGG